ncbi:MAG: glycosyltransferase family A protein [Planctomycetota bacterium]
MACLINNFNYAGYVCEAIQSALDQATPFSEIIVVDDGSTDDSVQRIRSEFGNQPVKLIRKPHGGQLSTFAVGIEAATSDWIKFLDADDVLKPDCVQRLTHATRICPSVDFLTSDYEWLGTSSGSERTISKRSYDHGLSVVSACLERHWVGGPTSSLAARTCLLRRLLPFPNQSVWKTRADDVLVLGASLMGAHQYFLGEKLIYYRVHGENAFIGQVQSRPEKLRHYLKAASMVHHYAEREGYDPNALASLIANEFKTRPRPSWSDLYRYLRMSWSHAPSKLFFGDQFGTILAHHARQRLSALRSGNQQSFSTSTAASSTTTANASREVMPARASGQALLQGIRT